MQPQALGLGDFTDRAQRVQRGGGRGAGSGDYRTGLVAGGQVLLDGRLQRVGAHGELLVGGDQADVGATEARQQRGLVHRAVGMGADVDDQWLGLGLQAAAHQRVIAGALAGADQRHQGAGRGGVLDHPAPLRRQTEQLAQPVEGGFLQLAQRRAGLPRQPQHAQAGAEEVAKHRRQRTVGGEVAVEIRVLPMRQAGHHQVVHIIEDRRERLALLGRSSRQGGLEVARLDLRHDRAFGHTLAVVGDQVDQLVAVLAKFFWGHARSPLLLSGVCAQQSRPGPGGREPRFAHTSYGKCACPPCTPNCDWRHSSKTRLRNQRCSAEACRRWCQTTQ
ncbi:hypothetical protein D3C76_778500 [compost metagenome]